MRLSATALRVLVRLSLALVAAALVATTGTSPALALGDEIQKVSTGGQHSCAVRSDGTVWCWGAAFQGQLGDGTTGDPTTNVRSTPVQVRRGGGFLTGITSVSAGLVQSCATRNDGTAWCWGLDADGALGDGTSGDATTHKRLTAVKVRQGGGVLTGVTAIAAGSEHSCARKSDGTAWCWGSDEFAQLGDGTTGDPTTHDRLTAVQVRRGAGFLTGVKTINAGGAHSCATRSDGTAWCWGLDESGQLGDGTTGDPITELRLKAVQVRQGGGFLTGVTGVSAGDSHSCASRKDGSAWCWGDDATGELGDGTTGDSTTHLRLKAVRVKKGGGFLSGVLSVRAGGDHSCARRSDDTAWCWGDDNNGQLGDGTTGDAVTHLRLKAVEVRRATGFLGGATLVDAGSYHSCARRQNRTVLCWGTNDVGQLGLGSIDSDPHPLATRVLFP